MPIVLGAALVLASTSSDVAVADAIEVAVGATCLDAGGGPGDTVAASEERPPVGIAVVIGPLARSR